MKNIFFLFLLFGNLCFGSISIQVERSSLLYDETGNPSQALLEILDSFKICHNGSWESIIHQTQKEWLNDPNKERWEFKVRPDDDLKKTYSLFSNLCMTQTIPSIGMNFEYGIILGATVQRVRQRFWFLKQQWDRGIRFEQLIVLTGDRPLAPEIENRTTLIDPSCSLYPFREGWYFQGTLPSNETEMALLVFDQLDLPNEWRLIPVIFVDTPCPQGKRRPRTSDTFTHWLSMNPQPGSVLIVSDQPFIGRQDAVGRGYFPTSFTIETIGKGFTLQDLKNRKQGTAILLDELARWIYEEQIRTHSQK